MNRAMNQVDPRSFEQRAAPAHGLSTADSVEAEGAIPADLADALHELEKIDDQPAFEARWAVFDALYPGHTELWASRTQRLIRLKAFDEAVQFIGTKEFDSLDVDGL